MRLLLVAALTALASNPVIAPATPKKARPPSSSTAAAVATAPSDKAAPPASARAEADAVGGLLRLVRHSKRCDAALSEAILSDADLRHTTRILQSIPQRRTTRAFRF